MSRSPTRPSIEASQVRLNRIAQPIVLIIITQESRMNVATNNNKDVARELVAKLKQAQWNTNRILVLAATRRAVLQLENTLKIKINDVYHDIASKNIGAVAYSRIKPGGDLIRMQAYSYDFLRHTPVWAGGAAPFLRIVTQSLYANSPAHGFYSAPSSPLGSPSPAAPPSPPLNSVNVNVNLRGTDLYTAFRLAMPGTGSEERTVAVLLYHGEEIDNTAFNWHINEMQKRLGKEHVGAVAHLPSKRKSFSSDDAAVVARALAPEHARAQGRAFVVLLQYATKGDINPREKWGQLRIRKATVCYTPAAFARAAASLVKVN